MNRWSGAALAAVVTITLTLAGTAIGPNVAQAAPPPYVPTGPLEAKYLRPGPFGVIERIGFGCCDATGAKYDIWYPAELGDSRHPIILWGNGTNAVTTQYAYLLRHLASWGFVVIGTENTNTGSGAEIRGSLDFLLRTADDPADPLHDRLDRDAVGAMGHSQGAAGVLNALRDAGGAIKTAVPVEVPAQLWCSSPIRCADPRALGAGSVFLVNGSADGVISPSRQGIAWQAIGLQSNQAYYEAIPASSPKVWATLNGPNHNDVQGQPDCAQASKPCTTGVYGYLGFPTAWFLAELGGDAQARAAFAPGGELFTPSPNWSNQVSTVR
ncbi:MULTISPECIES: hypothetical protein [unclassified Nocardia]|uniref:poly(ethylene terephthalate) hydrolase family protein n=1 Tax=unclassified Nocardia TaxID=2637762 RepID=UPI001CE465A4|nr:MULTISPECIES: hypothetical protein [unclassified Nocardia]